MPQLLHSGKPERTEPWDGSYEIVWSVYIRCSNKKKLREEHAPALEALIGQPHSGDGWLVESDKEFPGLFRIIAVEKLGGPYSDEFLLSLMKRLYGIAPDWHITARMDPFHPHGVYVHARYQTAKPGHNAPALEDALVELQPVSGAIFPATKL